MKNSNQFGVQELTLCEMISVEGGAFNFYPMHIYMPQYPEIIEWKPKIDFNRVITWA